MGCLLRLLWALIWGVVKLVFFLAVTAILAGSTFLWFRTPFHADRFTWYLETSPTTGHSVQLVSHDRTLFVDWAAARFKELKPDKRTKITNTKKSKDEEDDEPGILEILELPQTRFEHTLSPEDVTFPQEPSDLWNLQQRGGMSVARRIVPMWYWLLALVSFLLWLTMVTRMFRRKRKIKAIPAVEPAAVAAALGGSDVNASYDDNDPYNDQTDGGFSSEDGDFVAENEEYDEETDDFSSDDDVEIDLQDGHGDRRPE